MRLVLACLVLVLAGCAAPAAPPSPDTTRPSDTAPAVTSTPPIPLCSATTSATQHATPTQTLATRQVQGDRIHALVAHRDSIARYDTNGSEPVATPDAFLRIPFAGGLGYRFTADGTAVYSQQGLHRFDAQLRSMGWWNSTRFGAALHLGEHYYVLANGKLYTLSEQLQSVHNQALPNWQAPYESRFDLLLGDDNWLVAGTAGLPQSLLVYDLADPAQPRLAHTIQAPISEIPLSHAGLGPSTQGPRPTPWVDVHFAYGVVSPERIYVWRGGFYQGHPEQTVSRFQDLIVLRPSNWSLEHQEQQYLEDNHYGYTNGAHVGPIDEAGDWALLHLRGGFSLSRMVQEGPRRVPGCYVDVQMASFLPDEGVFTRSGERAILGNQNRIEAWHLEGSPGRFAEANLGKQLTDARWIAS